MLVLMANGIESANSAFGCRAIKTKGLSDDVEAAVEAGEFDTSIKAFAITPAALQIINNPITSFGTTFGSILLQTHLRNLKEEAVLAKSVRTQFTNPSINPTTNSSTSPTANNPHNNPSANPLVNQSNPTLNTSDPAQNLINPNNTNPAPRFQQQPDTFTQRRSMMDIKPPPDAFASVRTQFENVSPLINGIAKAVQLGS